MSDRDTGFVVELQRVGVRLQPCPFCGKIFGVGCMDNYAIPKHECIPSKEWKREIRKLKRLLKPLLEKSNAKKQKKQKKSK
jgi:hypothetical protein